MSEVISVANILALATKHRLKLDPSAISSNAQYGRACARGVLAIEAFGGVEKFIDQYNRLPSFIGGIYSEFVPQKLNTSMAELDALEAGFMSDDDEINRDFNKTNGERVAWAVGYELRDYIEE